MSAFVLVRSQLVPRDVEEVWAFFSRPENLAEITPPWLGFEMLTPSPAPMRTGALIDYRIRLGPVPLRWRTMITACEPPHRFVDEQLLGPYSWWHHTHTFEARDGGTLIGDTVRYLPPLGILGRTVHALVIRRQLEGIFAHRRRVVVARFGTADEGVVP